MTRISTHVLDLMQGKPAAAILVELELKDAAGKWHTIGSARTDGDGRCAQLLTQEDLHPGLYRLSFDTGKYFSDHKIAGLYPTVSVNFEVRAGESQFHIPLLLSANGYTTYRGS